MNTWKWHQSRFACAKFI